MVESKKNSLWGRVPLSKALKAQSTMPYASPHLYMRPPPLCLLFPPPSPGLSFLSAHIHCAQTKGKFGQDQTLQEQDLIKLKGLPVANHFELPLSCLDTTGANA
jgi:hypothetical protein